MEIKSDGTYVDLTLGRAGHSLEILKKLINGRLICFDKDNEAIKESYKKLQKISPNFTLIQNDFRFLKAELEKLGINEVDGILADLGVSSPQIDDPTRGFSYSQEGPLDMRMNQQNSFSAKDIIDNFDESELTKILIKNADVKLANLVAKAIVAKRPIKSTSELVEIIKNALPAKIVREKNPAKAVFQALRIEVNDELGALTAMLADATQLLKKDGKILIITFHSKEDSIVKNFFQKQNYVDPRLNKLPINIQKIWKQKIIFPSEDEKLQNNRSRSAKLRVVKKLSI
ncbi:Ribosomal RNA small subunit methyltransferase H [Metamycoplasma arthritidis]|uniref:Ribosomal RNA small subunit methyltransferase H n=1 Tax=Metamycoplasma arthritidis (strain 158L3-1) TaxID=243272 RepID=RSMH_META1|nr:RecName: Full=Ribosomal RNA small subunit methyltransferase H; AltName: Full=16S rRNA m(4)C1402 methyltransferase; AltName: Full=rRNA (cytosine-N(4)-)-methyltransferase RsmH [Metamycoplasma arthritidis 158L3-1]ACF07166.1 S-adenosyl-methyltransferase [Metamycoplasma arthritidis 158L3-1]VEU78690.1 Ribosomal RNA small subunit methyltransferase H [Metamycoplasma arthritidis]